MTWEDLLIVAIMMSSFLPGIVIFMLPEEKTGLRTGLNLFGAGLKMALIIIMDIAIYNGRVFEMRLQLMEGVEMFINADPLSALFATLSGALWLLTTVYAIGYLEDSPNRSHFFGYFSICVTVTIGIAMAGNLITFLLFYEMLTLATYPLIIHRGTEKALAAGRNYLIYAFVGGGIFLFAVIWLHTLTSTGDFTAAGFAVSLLENQAPVLRFIFLLIIAGVGVKAALVPLHGWLPRAMIAPAPVSALLHAVAVVKAGAFGISRIVLDVYGVKNIMQLNLLPWLMFISSGTILWGSFKALQQNGLKQRLAYSTVSQISYITLGISMAQHPLALIGGLVHLIHQGIMKITLFFCAGNLAETLGIHKISEMDGVGRRLPLTMAAFTVAALGMIGIPPTIGFVSKWYLCLGGIEAENWWVIVVLVVSSILNGIYFLPIVTKAWFGVQKGPWPQEKKFGSLETHWMLLLPPLITAIAVIAAGIFANAQISPLAWVKFVVQEYSR